MEHNTFTAAIEAHLELQRQNSSLEQTMPIALYRDAHAINLGTEAPSSSTANVSPLAADAPTEVTSVRSALRDDPDSWWPHQLRVPAGIQRPQPDPAW